MNILLRCLILFALAIASTANAAPSVSVVFVMDESGSVSSSNFLLEKQGFINALNSVPTDGGVEVSAIGFASSSSVLVNPTVLTSSSLASVKTALENNSQSGGSTAMDSAINTAANLLANSTAPSKIICLATDGYPNSASATTVAANNAKALSINLAPIGIGMDSYGRTFLDSIASNPPVPAPTNFTEFATVVKNDCIGAIKSALNIQMTPDVVDFGTFNATTIASDIQVCGSAESISVTNKSNQPATLSKIEFTGQDATAYELVSLMGVAADKLSFPITLTPGVSATAKIKLNYLFDPVDGSYDAVLKVTAKDSQGIEGSFSTTLVAKVSGSADSCLAMKVIDASPLVSSISDTGEPLKKDKSAVGEIDVSLALQNDSKGDLERKGLVADGNSRLLLVAKTRKTSGKVRFEITKPNLTEARLYGLKFTPTYKGGTREYDTNGKTILDLDIATDPDGNGQVTAVLRAGERFLGAIADVKADFGIKACILDDATGNCSVAVQEKSLEDRKAPVIMIHGLWANPSSFMHHSIYGAPDAPTGLSELFRNNGYTVAVADYCKGRSKSCKDNYTYPDYIGPSQHMTSDATWLHDYVDQVCSVIKNSHIACTRADLVGHSMGGLMSRAFINGNKFYKADKNFNVGSIRRLITLSTPHIGSGVANLLTKHDAEIGSCIRVEKRIFASVPSGYSNGSITYTDYAYTGGEVIDFIKGQMESRLHKRVASAIDNLQLGDVNNQFLNLSNGFMRNSLTVPVFALYGDIDDGVGMNLNSLQLDGWKKILADKVEKQCQDKGLTNNQCASELFDYMTGCSTSEIFNSEDSDGIVPLSSSRWEQYMLDDKYRVSVAHEHTGMGTEPTIMNLVLNKINAPLSDFYIK